MDALPNTSGTPVAAAASEFNRDGRVRIDWFSDDEVERTADAARLVLELQIVDVLRTDAT
jgi:hypothetical protein